MKVGAIHSFTTLGVNNPTAQRNNQEDQNPQSQCYGNLKYWTVTDVLYHVTFTTKSNIE